jgi:hypothetical protein
VNPTAARRAELWIAGLVAAVGLWGLLLARDVSFTSPRGARIADSVEFSPFGALVTIGLALLAGAGAAIGAQRVVLAAGVAFGFIAVVVLLVLGRDANWFGARGSNVSMLLGASAGLIALALAPRAPGDRP